MEIINFYNKAKFWHLQKFKSKQDAEDFAAYVVTVKLSGTRSTDLSLKNLAIDFVRLNKGRNQSKSASVPMYYELLGSPQKPDDVYLRKEMADKIDLIFENDCEKLIIKSHVILGKTVAELTRETGVSKFKIESMVKKAIKVLSKTFVLILFTSCTTTPKECIEQKDSPLLSVDERASIVSECYLYEK